MAIDIEQLRADMEAGTPGPWVSDYENAGEWGENWAILATDRFHEVAEMVGTESDARRIARLPDLEAEYLRLREAADALADAASHAYGRAEDWSNDNLTDENARDWMGHVDPALARLCGAFADYRAAVKGAVE